MRPLRRDVVQSCYSFSVLCQTNGCLHQTATPRIDKCQGCIRQEFHDAGYIMVGEYRQRNEGIASRCRVHGVHCRPSLRGIRKHDRACPECSSEFRARNARKHSQDDIRALFESCGAVMIGFFVTVNKPVEARFESCGHQYPVWIATLKRDGGCYYCRGRRSAEKLRLPTSAVTEAFDAAGFSLLSRYVNNHTRNRLRCKRCDHVFWRAWKPFSTGSHRCPACAPQPPTRPMLAQEDVQSRLLDAGLIMTGRYTGYNEPIPATCINCGNEHCSPTLANLKHQGGCKVCGHVNKGNAKRTPLDSVKAIMDAADIDFIGPYLDQNSPTPGRHRPCGNLVSPRIVSLLKKHSRGCMACGYARRRVSRKSAVDVPGYLYLLEFDLTGERFCKVGIGREGSGRVEQFRSHCGAVVRQIVHSNLAVCYAAEQKIIVAYADDAYLPVSPCLRSGHTECLAVDVDLDLRAWADAAAADESAGTPLGRAR